MTQFYNTARCCSTRASLLCGLYSHQTGVGHMVEDRGLDGYRGMLNEHCVTLAQVARSAGYGTYMVGKWHVTHELKPDGPKTNWPIQRGFDRLYGTLVGAGNYWDPPLLCRDNTPITMVNDQAYQPPAGQAYYYTDAIGDNAVRFIADHHAKTPDKPFFMYCAFTAAHWPMQARPEDIEKYKGKYDAGYGPVRAARLERMRQLGLVKPEWKLTNQAGDWDKVKDKAWEARCMEVYAAMVDRMDQNVGKIVAQLKASGQLDNTLILYLQDNGACAEPTGRQNPPGVPLERPAMPTLKPWGPDHVDTNSQPKQTRDGYPIRRGPGVMPGPGDTHIAYGQAWANVSNTPFREYKHWEHEGGISTPLIAHWPAAIKRHGELDAQPGHLIDVMATLVDVSGATYPKEFGGHAITPMEGRSLVPVFAGKVGEERALYFEHEGNRAVREGRWKLVAKGPGGAWELYDMEADRTETNDVASSNPAKVTELADKWEAWAKRSGAKPWPWKVAAGGRGGGAGK
jgi:arylsulfatase